MTDLDKFILLSRTRMGRFSVKANRYYYSKVYLVDVVDMTPAALTHRPEESNKELIERGDIYWYVNKDLRFEFPLREEADARREAAKQAALYGVPVVENIIA